MGTTAEKLTYLNTTKQNLKTVINTIGAGLTDESTFRSYANVLNDKILGAINGDVDLFEEYPKVSGNGADLSLNGVVEGKMSITPQGVSSQAGEPTPTTPYPVKSVTGENSLIISNKNLFDESQLIKNYYINASGQIVASNGFAYSNLIPVKQATYMLSGRNTENITSNKRVHGYDENGDWVKQITYVAVTGISDYSTSILIDDASIKYIRLSIYGSDSDVQLELGSSITSYIEHQSQTYQLSLGNIELCSTPDGTIRDAIIGTPDNWYKREYIGKVVLDGSENWEDRPSYQYADRFVLGTVMRDLTQNDMLINNFKYGNANSNTYPYLAKSGGQCVINFSEFGSTTLEQFKEWLTTHNTIVYGTRVTPTDIPITDQILISQLNDIYNNAHSYNGVTNITTTYANGNEQMYLDIESLKNVWEVTE